MIKTKCILCEKEAIEEAGRKGGKTMDAIFVNCETCKKYYLDAPDMHEQEKMPREERRMLSVYTRECFELGEEPPEIGNPETLTDIIAEYEGKTVDEKLENLIWYLRKESKEYGDSVPWKIERDWPITYSLSPQGFEKIVHLARDKGLLDIESRDSLKLTEEGWKLGSKIMENRRQS